MEKTWDMPLMKSGSVVEQVKDWIIEQLIRGTLRPGDRLPTEAELCAQLGASRNSVREAIKQLEAYGVVYIKRADGTFVTEGFQPRMLSPVLYAILLQENSWEDFVELRRATDIGTLYVLIGKGLDREALAPLRAALEALEAAVSRPDPDVEAITRADCEFHNTVIRLTDNPQLMTLSEYINRLTVPSRIRTTEAVVARGEIEAYIRLHRQLYRIVEDGDKAGIESAVLDHYVFWATVQSLLRD